jgi:hypothetical protein
MPDQMQHQRFERKFFLTERQAIQIRDYVKGYLVPDEYSATRPDFSYPVHSIYLDSKALDTYWATVHCEKSRYKLRVRFYDDNPEAPLFFEIKRRENECILKQRSAVRRSAGPLLLAGQLPQPEHLLRDTPAQMASLQRFCYLMQRLNAGPAMHIAYSREAWMSEQTNSIRVTIDRHVRGEPWREAIFHTQLRRPIYPFGKKHVLELKFTDRFPVWFNDLVRHFDLTQTGAPKYCGSIMETGEDRVINYNPLVEGMREETEHFPRKGISESGSVEAPYV